MSVRARRSPLPSLPGVALGATVLSALLLLAAVPAAGAEDAQGFTSLLSGGDLSAWRGYKMEEIPDGWSAEGDVLHFAPPEGEDARRADLITREQYEDFELRLPWEVSPGGPGGVFFRVSEDQPATYSTGAEMQVLDDERHRDGKNPLTSAGSNYALDAPSSKVVRPAEQWNEAVLRVEGPKVTHWLNGEKIVEYELWTDEWKQKVADSKFRSMPGYGLNRTGHVALQDHGDEIWFRDIRIKRLD